jgi:excisionase family DNA binding protein
MTEIIIEKLEELTKAVNLKLKDKWINTEEVCDYTGLSESTIRRAIQKGSLKVSRRTGKNLFRVSWIDGFLEG